MATVPLNLSETVEPNRRLSTSSQGLSAAQRRQGSVICLITVQGFVSEHEHGRVKILKFSGKELLRGSIFLALRWRNLWRKIYFLSSLNFEFLENVFPRRHLINTLL